MEKEKKKVKIVADTGIVMKYRYRTVSFVAG